MLTLIHNQSCSKSRCLLEYLQKKNISFTLRNYLQDPLTEMELYALFEKLQLSEDSYGTIIRMPEAQLRQKLAGERQPLVKIVQMIGDAPQLLQRPILVLDDQAIIGRPTERAIEFLKSMHWAP